MDVFHFHLRPLIDDVDVNVVRKAVFILEGYFRDVIRFKPGSFSGVSGHIATSAASIGERDLLVYITQTSLAKMIWPNVQFTGDAGGCTTPWEPVLSEVFWPVAKRVAGRNTGQLPNVLANLAFHEFAHNKHVKTGKDVHTEGGMLMLAAGLIPGTLINGKPSDENKKFVAEVIAEKIRQNTCGFFSNLAGY